MAEVAAEEPGAPWWHKIGQMIFVYYMLNTVKNVVFTTPAPTNTQTPQDYVVPASSVVDSLSDPASPSFPAYNLWQDHQSFQLSVFLSPNETVQAGSLFSDAKTHLVYDKRFTYDWDGQLEDLFGEAKSPNAKLMSLSEDLPEMAALLKRNITIYAHAFATTAGFSMTPGSKNYHPSQIIYTRAPLLRWFPRKVEKQNLLSKSATNHTTTEVALSTPTVDTVMLPELHQRLLHDFTGYPAGQFPPELVAHYTLHPKLHGYNPPFYIDEFWALRDKMVTVNETSTQPLSISFTPTSLPRWRLQLAMMVSWQSQEQYGMSSRKETDDFKRMVLETQPVLLATTFLVSIAHMVLETLAFKNDIQFFKSGDSKQGQSVRTMFYNVVSQLIIFLYLLDNDTSFMILFSTGTALAIELWKISKTNDVTVDGVFPFVHVIEREETRETEAGKYDREAFYYLSLAFVPLCIGYSVYAMIYQEHKSWYSFVLGSMVGTIYAFGFISMCPQIYMNYKMQSVAHLPWRMLTYKALNTVIDDLFAFIITMPWLHRLACFRDDLIFVIFLYQKYKYRTDYTRTNEFGVSFAEPEAITSSSNEIEDDSKKVDDENKENEENEEEEKVDAKDNNIDDIDDEVTPIARKRNTVTQK